METIVIDAPVAVTTATDSAPKKKLTCFRELGAWKEGHSLAKDVFDITSAWSGDQAFGLGNPMRRAALAVTSRLAEGFNKSGYREKSRSYGDARSSLSELHNQLILSTDVGALEESAYDRLLPQVQKVDRILAALIAKTLSFVKPRPAAGTTSG